MDSLVAINHQDIRASTLEILILRPDGLDFNDRSLGISLTEAIYVLNSGLPLERFGGFVETFHSPSYPCIGDEDSA